jgi:hypothetical protein
MCIVSADNGSVVISDSLKYPVGTGTNIPHFTRLFYDPGVSFGHTYGGKITDANGDPLNKCLIKAVKIQEADSSFIAMDSFTTGADGRFTLNAKDSSYVLIFPSGSNLMPTWDSAAPTINEAYFIRLKHGFNLVTLSPLKKTSFKGAGTISGTIRQCPSCRIPNKAVSHLRIVLINEYGEIAAWAYTDSLGRFSFSRLMDGKYSVYADKPYIRNKTTAPIIQLQDSATHLKYYLYPDHLGEDTSMTAIHLPGYLSDCRITIKGNELIAGPLPDGNLEWSIIDINGKILMRGRCKGSQSSLTVNVAGLTQGVYLLQIGNLSTAMRFVKE